MDPPRRSISGTVPKRRLGDILREAGVVTEQQLEAALQEQRKWGGQLGRTLIEMGMLDEPSMARAISTQLSVPLVDLDNVELSTDVGRWMPLHIAECYGVMPLDADEKTRTLHIATFDPTNAEALQETAYATGMRLTLKVATASAIERAIRRYYYGESPSSTAPSTAGPAEPEIDIEEESGFAPGALTDNNLPGTGRESSASGLQEHEVALDLTSSSTADNGLGQLVEQVNRLEFMVADQARTVRSIFELLVQRGVLSQDEYAARMRRGGGGGSES